MARTMRALQLRESGVMPKVVEVPVPDPGPGQVRLKVAGSGLCHSDLYVINAKPSWFPLPLTIGHEPTGWVDAMGAGVAGFKEGDAYAVYFPWGCGHCARCAHGEENICEGQVAGPGAGIDGGMAEYMLIHDPRHLVPLGRLDPVTTAPLMCAGLTSYHTIMRSLWRLVPGSAAVLIGIGGLGHIAIQMLRALTPARIIAVDTSAGKLKHALEIGAHEAVAAGPDAADRIKALTGGLGAALIVDMVGTDQTLGLAIKVLGRKGKVELVGVAGGTLPFGFYDTARDASIGAPYAGTLPELYEVVALAEAGLVAPEVERVSFDTILDAYHRLEHGQIRGRAVLAP
ncbi:MAG TPA: NAD(P)-dependent alcohol dehydrogenase [Stellaceae bacterium]|nr:NAD(P)-dependent alcohol dehydrogenase [Stellaceae bacterium]